MGQVDVTNLTIRQLKDLLLFYKRQGGGSIKSYKGRKYIIFGSQKNLNRRKID